ncbi:hypothetical protein R9C00_17035 [Flammeovirgaceae bacterium SG7u.111]|nr:hypothetical protein [Flammeovirgaceae bacterium SG7u.132]WPO33406.1 hypothetical protein R9C00_17035 [Flammeovirgaceae bacterium SG7u.111]
MRNLKFMKNTAFIATLLFICFTSIDAFSQFYIGGNIGNSFVNKELKDVNLDNYKLKSNSLAYKIYGGFGKDFLGAEGGYRNLGEVKDEDSGINLSSKISGWDVAARGKINIGPIFAFGKAGAFFAKEENMIGGFTPTTTTENSTNFLWGLGAGVKLGTLGIRAEFESLDIKSSSKISMLTIGATFDIGEE